MTRKFSWRKYLIWVLVVVMATAALYYLYHNFRLTGPDEFNIATGRSGGAYNAYARQYATHLAEQEGVTLNLVETAGSVETLDKLIARQIPVGFVQSGTIGDRDSSGLYSLGSIFYEPILIFYRRDRFDGPLRYLYELEGRTVGIGEVGSGTNLMARLMLSDNELDDRNTNFIESPSVESHAALTSGELDAAFLVTAPAARDGAGHAGRPGARSDESAKSRRL